MFDNCLKCPNFYTCLKKFDDYADFCAGPENKDDTKAK